MPTPFTQVLGFSMAFSSHLVKNLFRSLANHLQILFNTFSLYLNISPSPYVLSISLSTESAYSKTVF